MSLTMARSGLRLASMGVDELLELRDEIGDALSQRSAELKEQLRRLENGSWSSTPRRAAYRLSKGVKLPPKYRDPKDPSLVWAGRGAQPRWMRELIKAGAKQEDFLIGGPKTAKPSKSRKTKSRKTKSRKASAKAKTKKAA
jgi:DNA-binding protein H-NS